MSGIELFLEEGGEFVGMNPLKDYLYLLALAPSVVGFTLEVFSDQLMEQGTTWTDISMASRWLFLMSVVMMVVVVWQSKNHLRSKSKR